MLYTNIEKDKCTKMANLGPETQKMLTLSTILKGKEYIFKLCIDVNKFSQKIMWKFLSAGKLYEPETSKFIVRVLREGDCFIDIGSHVGYFSLLAASIVGTAGRIYAFEPEQDNYNHLKNHIALNNFVNINAFNLALGEQNRTTQFFVNLDNDGGHALWDVGHHPFNAKSRANPHVADVNIATLDSILDKEPLENLKLIKIDTEGSEYNILRGAINTIIDYEIPYIICEINRFGLEQMGTSETELRAFMESIGYCTYLLANEEPGVVKLSRDQYVKGKYVFNVLFAK